MQDKDKVIAELQIKVAVLEQELFSLKKLQENSDILSSELSQLVNDPLYLEKLVALMPGHIYWQNKEGVIIGCNDNQARFFGYNSRYEIIGKTPYDLLPKDAANAITETNRRLMASGEVSFAEERMVTSEGQERIYFSQKIPLKNIFGETIGLMGVSLDITKHKELEEKLTEAIQAAHAADQAKTEFLTNMSHDIRTPFGNIIGVAEGMLLKEKDEEKQKELSYIQKSSKQLLALLNNVLDFARFEAEKLQQELEETDIRLLLQELIDLMLPEVKNKGLAFEMVIQEDIPSLIFIDRMRLQRIILNLLSNAIKFTRQGKITINLSWDARINGINFSVKDTGIGIDRSFQCKVFEKFSRGFSSNKQANYEGSGIGLYIVKRFIEDLKGDISLISEPGKGTEFTFSFPVIVCPKREEANQQRNRPEYGQIENYPYATLVVEDNEIAQFIAKKVLEEFGCSVDIAGSLSEARKFLSKKAYDITFLDFGLPDGSGCDLIANIKTSCIDTLIIAITANEEDAIKKAPSIEVVKKPLTREKCRKILNTLEQR